MLCNTVTVLLYVTMREEVAAHNESEKEGPLIIEASNKKSQV